MVNQSWNSCLLEGRSKEFKACLVYRMINYPPILFPPNFQRVCALVKDREKARPHEARSGGSPFPPISPTCMHMLVPIMFYKLPAVGFDPQSTMWDLPVNVQHLTTVLQGQLSVYEENKPQGC